VLVSASFEVFNFSDSFQFNFWHLCYNRFSLHFRFFGQLEVVGHLYSFLSTLLCPKLVQLQLEGLPSASVK